MVSYDSLQGKLVHTSKEFRALFLLLFTKEIIRHSKINDVDRLETIIKKKTLPPKKEELILLEGYGEMMPSMMYQSPPVQRKVSKLPLVFPTGPAQRVNPQLTRQPQQPQQQFQPQQFANKYFPKRQERIPEPQLPLQLQYIRPVPSEMQLDLGRLNQIFQGPEVMSIECNGPDEPLKVKGPRGSQTLNMNLTKEEIAGIILKFSEATKIPANEGIFKVAAGNMIISAVI